MPTRQLLRLLQIAELGPIVGLVLIVLVFDVMSGGKFLTAELLSGATSLASAVGIVAIGVTILMISGEFDLSVSAVYAFAPIMMGQLMVSGWSEWPAFAAAMVAAAVIGLINGTITTVFRVPSFITTLGTLLALTGINFLWTGGYPIPYEHQGFLFHFLGGRIGTTAFFAPVGWMLLIAIVLWAVLQWTPYGNWSFAAGGRAGVARAMGVPDRLVKTVNFIIAAGLAGFVGCAQFAQLSIVSAGFGENYNLLAIVAAVIGGTSLFGVTGSIPGAIVGALILGSIQTGLVLIGAPSSWYTSFIGAILILVVIVNARLRRITTGRVLRA